MIHELKCESEVYKHILLGSKNFEFRKNDRDFKEGDELVLIEVVNNAPTGRRLSSLLVTYILYGGRFGLPEDYCVMEFFENT